MTAAFTARKRAEEFNELIERATLDGLADSRYAELVTVLTALRETTPVRPRADFSTDLRSRLMAAAETSMVPAERAATATRVTEPATGRSRREKRLVAALGGFAIVAASGSMAMAAQTALPGDTLYPLKRALENVHAGVQSGDDKGGTLLASASGRLHEVDELSQSGSQDPRVIAQTLQDFTDQATEASAILLSTYQSTGSMDSLQQLQSFTADSMAELQALRNVVPDEARQMIFQATQVLHQITEQALDACPTCALEPLLSSATTTTDDLTSASLPDLVQNLVTDLPEPSKSAPSKPDHGGSDTGTDQQSEPSTAQPSSGSTAQPATHSDSGAPSDSSSPSSSKSDDSSSPVDPLTHPSDSDTTAPESDGHGKGTVKHILGSLGNGGVNASGGGVDDIVKGVKHVVHSTVDDTVNGVGDLLGGGTGN